MDFLTQLNGTHAYVLLALCLYLSSVGMPLPQDVPLLAGGYLVGLGLIGFPGLAVCVVASCLLGDLTAYWFGRRFGVRLIAIAPFRWFLTPERFVTVRRRFRQHQAKALFFGRFVAGVRMATFLIAGMSRMNVAKFALIDFLALCVGAPIPILLAYWVGNVHRAQQLATEVDLLLAGVVVVGAIVIYCLYRFLPRAAAKAAAVDSDPNNGKDCENDTDAANPTPS